MEVCGQTMGTTWRVKALITTQQSEGLLQQGIQAQLDQVVAQMSPWENDSHLMRFNHAPARTWHTIPDAFYKVLDHAVFVAQQTQGAYDPSIGHLTNLWGFGPTAQTRQTVDQQRITTAKQYTNWRLLSINHQIQAIYQAGNIHLDLCSTAKGFGVDQVARYLQQQAIHHYLVEVGGELRGSGCKPDGQPWWVALEDVPTSANVSPCVVALCGLSIATSGDYNRYFEHEGKRYSHTIDPRTGYPVQHGVASVTVLHPECMIADALATAMTVLGLEEGMTYAKQLHTAARFIVREEHGFSEHFSPAFLAMMDDEDA